MMHWKSIGYEGLDRSKCMPQRAEIMNYVDEGHRSVQMVQILDGQNDSTLVEAT
jgi:hypothetical protein